jgi:hypothetical protein
MLALQSKVKASDSEKMRLKMNLKLQEGHLASYKRQLADAEDNKGRGATKNKRDMDLLQVYIYIYVICIYYTYINNKPGLGPPAGQTQKCREEKYSGIGFERDAAAASQ